jgi:hypothetical protein
MRRDAVGQKAYFEIMECIHKTERARMSARTIENSNGQGEMRNHDGDDDRPAIALLYCASY